MGPGTGTEDESPDEEGEDASRGGVNKSPDEDEGNAPDGGEANSSEGSKEGIEDGGSTQHSTTGSRGGGKVGGVEENDGLVEPRGKNGSKGEAKGTSPSRRSDEVEQTPKKGSYSAKVTLAKTKNRREDG